MRKELIPKIIELVEKLGTAFVERVTTESFMITQPEEGSIWISSTDGTWGTWNGQVVSAYFHPSKSHSATTEGKLGLKRSEAPGGHWAISLQTRALCGNKTFTKDDFL